MTAAEALNKLVDHLLGENWYSIYMNTEDVYKDIVDTICSRYRGKKEDRVTQWRRRRKRGETMNALKKYKERQNQAKAREIVDENLDGFIEHMDLLILYVLHAEFGFGKDRLTRFFNSISDYYRYFRDRFVKPGDENRFWAKEKRLDTFALKQYLLDCGFDYDAICEKKLQENKEMKKENEQ